MPLSFATPISILAIIMRNALLVLAILAVPAEAGPTFLAEGPALGDAPAAVRAAEDDLAARLGLTLTAPLTVAPFASAIDAALRLLAVHGVEPTAAEARALLALDAAPEPAGPALARLLDALAAFAAAASEAFADAPPVPALPERLSDVPDLDVIAWSIEARSRWPPVLAARQAALERASEFADAVAATSARLGSGPIVVGNVLILDLEGRPSRHDAQVAFIVDVGGDDVYRNNAGGAGGPYCTEEYPCFLASAVVDLAGNDRYVGHGTGGTNGAGYGAAGLLVDVAGDDLYAPRSTSANGGSAGGLGLLVDGSGRDVYSGDTLGLNGGGFGGIGILVDGGGDDTYFAGPWFGLAQNGGGAFGGAGALIDLGVGTDDYSGGSYGVNGGGAYTGVGLLVDEGGDDRYRAGDYGTNGGGFLGSNGLLRDAGGNDAYEAGRRGANGGAVSGAGCITYPTCVGGIASTGLLHDAGGRDRYADRDGGAGLDRTVLPKGTVGAQVDA